MRISEMMSSGNSILIHLQARSLGAGQLQHTVHANFLREKAYFQRMKIDFPFDLCIIKEHNNETRFSVVSSLLFFL